jgi:Na+-transporting methylmalonyl-CoA/oxaloacetate decarboxylase gamma subunit
MAHVIEQFDHPAWLTAAGTLAGYGLVLLFMFLLLFVVPYLLFPA